MTPEDLVARFGERFGEDAAAEQTYGLLTVDVPAGGWLDALTFARDDLGCTYFDWLTGVDELAEGYAVVAHVYALEAGHHLLLRTRVPREAPRLASATVVFAGASWHERETYEMFGVEFDGHPNLIPLLLPDGFEGYPLRKEFVLAARAAKPWPGAKEPGESDRDAGAPSRRRMLPPGVPDPHAWGPRPAGAPLPDPAAVASDAATTRRSASGRSAGGAGAGGRVAGSRNAESGHPAGQGASGRSAAGRGASGAGAAGQGASGRSAAGRGASGRGAAGQGTSGSAAATVEGRTDGVSEGVPTKAADSPSASPVPPGPPPAEVSPAGVTPKESPLDDASQGEEIRAEPPSVKGPPAESAPAESIPVESAPIESASAESAPAVSAPAVSAPAVSAPAESAPAEPAPAESAPAESVPAESTRAEASPPAPPPDAPPSDRRVSGPDPADPRGDPAVGEDS